MRTYKIEDYIYLKQQRDVACAFLSKKTPLFWFSEKKAYLLHERKDYKKLFNKKLWHYFIVQMCTRIILLVFNVITKYMTFRR